MKRITSMLLGFVLACGVFSGCEKPGVPEVTKPADSTAIGSQPTVQQTQPTEPSNPTEPVMPDSMKEISVSEVEKLTVTVLCTGSFVQSRTITYAISNGDGNTIFYEQNTGEDYSYESLCVVKPEGTTMYSAQDGQELAPVELTGEYDTPDGYFRCELANLGFDYRDHFQTDGLIAEGEITLLGRGCDVYTLAYTDHQGAGYKAEVCVDRQTGLWLRLRREIPGTHDYILMEALSVEESAQIIPQLP